MRLALKIFTLSVCCITGCNQSGDWQQKYADCKVLASVMVKEPTPFIRVPDCEKIPQLCSKDPKSAECLSETEKYYRK